MSTKKGKKAATRPSTTALARRPAPKPAPKRRKPVARKEASAVQVLPDLGQLAADMILPAMLDSNAGFGRMGLVEVKLTPEENAALAAPVELSDLRVKPDGVVYLPHTGYARWLTRAFGRTGWAMRPVGNPQINEKLVLLPYVLLIHGNPCVGAWGEQDYHPNNRNQSYGDAIESTRGNALRRCCKQLSMGLELWDREGFVEPYLHEFCVRVDVRDRHGDIVQQWRRRIDPPLKGEIDPTQQQQQQQQRRSQAPPAHRPAPRDVEPVAHHGKENEPVTDAQLQRLWVIARNRGRSEAEMREYLLTRFNYRSSHEIKRRDYETICAAVEHPGPLLQLGRG